MIISFQHIKKYHGANLVLEDLTLEIRQGERVGLIGRNGCGKSTMLQLISGELQPDEGQLAIRKGTQIGYLTQIPVEQDEASVYEVLALGFKELISCKAQMVELESQMAGGAEQEQCLERMLKNYAELQESFESGGGYEMDARMNQVTNGLRIPSEQFNRPFSSLSGGEKTKVGLAALLIERPNLLLLDEPTNHLDLTGVEWLESYLNAYDGTCIIVSHDRYFLDRVVTKVVEIEDGEAFVYYTNYSGYLQEKDERLLQQFASYQEQQKKIKQMKETIKRLEEWGRIGDNVKFFRRAASMQKALDRMEKVKRPDLEPKAVDFELKQADRSGQKVLTMERVSKGYGDRLILNGIEQSLQYGNKVALIGNNGSGKSTLFKLLLGQEMCDAGTVTLGSRTEIGYLSQEEMPPQDRKKTVLQMYREEAGLEEGEARGRLAGYLFYGGDVFKAVHLLSGGEWTRLRLAILMNKQPNFLLLDEPTNHLDISSREALEAALEDFPGTVLVVSHDRYFINRIAQRVWELDEGKITGYLGNFDSYKEKHKQLQQLRDHEEVNVPNKPKSSVFTSGEPHPKQEMSLERRRTLLEQSIAEDEQQLAQFDDFFQLSNCTDNAAKYNQAVAEWQALKIRLEVLYEQWIELEKITGKDSFKHEY